MKKIIITALLLCSVACAKAKPEVVAAHKTTHEIAQRSMLDSSDCSATAIGPQALLTASHCEQPTDLLAISGVDQPVIIKERLHDNLDHTIYLVDGVTFTDYAKFEPNNMQISEEVFIIGNPDEFTDIFRHGYFVGVQEPRASLSDLLSGTSKPPTLLFDMNIYHGDSGAGIFTFDGTLVGVISARYISKSDEPAFTLAMAYPINFTKEQLEEARTFTTPQKKDSENDGSGTGTSKQPAQ